MRRRAGRTPRAHQRVAATINPRSSRPRHRFEPLGDAARHEAERSANHGSWNAKLKDRGPVRRRVHVETDDTPDDGSNLRARIAPTRA
jgi:hypothetical protein